MPNNPPIPPNHPRFRSELVWGDEHEEGFFYTISGWQRIRSLSGMVREDCANAARCAWLDVAQQLVDEATPHSEIRVIAELLQAEQYANAWAAFGKMKKEGKAI